MNEWGLEPYLSIEDGLIIGRRWLDEEGSAPLIKQARMRLSRRGLLTAAVLGPLAVCFPRQSLAATNFLWEGAGSYGVGVANTLTTELNALGNSSGNTLSTLGAAFQNTNARLFADFEFVSGGTITPVAGAFVEYWQLLSLDGGTAYEDGSASVAPGRPADFTIKVRAGTTITPRAGVSKIPMPVAFWKPIARNELGVSMAATSNLIRYVLYSPQF